MSPTRKRSERRLAPDHGTAASSAHVVQLPLAERYFSLRTKRSPADESTREREESLSDIGAALVAHFETAETVEPGERPLDHPAIPTEALARLDAAAGDAGMMPRERNARRQRA